MMETAEHTSVATVASAATAALETPERGRGRPPVELDDAKIAQLENSIKLQGTRKECAAMLGMCDDTLGKLITEHYGYGWTELKERLAPSGRLSLRQAQFKAALDGDKTMLVWLGKQYLGQTDRIVQRHDVVTQTEIVVPIEAVEEYKRRFNPPPEVLADMRDTVSSNAKRIATDDSVDYIESGDDNEGD